MGDRLIIGLGNPGSKYEKTRHNLGFMVVAAFAEKMGWKFKRGFRLQGYVASGMVGDVKTILLLPTTYMNLSGQAVRKAVEYYKIAQKELVVVVDDVYLAFGTLRFRSKGSPGGHNGLKSIDSSLRTQEYSRLKVGIGPFKETVIPESLEAFVLNRFDADEQKLLPQVVEKGRDVLEHWVTQGEDSAMRRAGELSNSNEGL